MSNQLEQVNVWIAKDFPNATKVTTGFFGSRIIWLKNAHYAISYSDEHKDGKGYLGCIADANEPLPGETWTRGNDLPDGYFSEKTWNKISARIKEYEASF